MTTTATLAERHKWRNFTGGVIHGVFFAVSMAFHTDTVLPNYIGLLSDSKFYVGLLSSILVGGAILPQLWFSWFREPKRAKQPWLLLGIGIRIASWFLLGLSTLFLGAQHPKLILYSLFFWLLAFSVAGAMAGVAFNDVIGKAIPGSVRGSFFSLRQFLGGLLAFFSGLAVKQILGSGAIPFPTNHAYLFLLSSLALGIASFGFWLIREPLEESVPSRLPPRDYFRSILNTWRGDWRLRELITVQVVMGLNLLVIPFYVVFARERLQLSGGTIGTFVMYQVAGSALANFLIIDIAPPGRRSTYTGVQGTLTSPTLIYPFLGGLLIPVLGYPAVFGGVALVMVLLAAWMAVRA